MTGNNGVGQVDAGSVVVICSSPNERGIHQYAKTLEANISDSVLIVCPWQPGYYLVWEMVGILLSGKEISRYSHVFFSNTRISPLLWPLLRKDRVTVVVHDLMDTSQETYKKINRFVLFRWIKITCNTVLIRQSVKRAGCVISNSTYTKRRLEAWLKGSCPPVHVLHPPPSFKTVSEVRGVRMVELFDDRKEKVVKVLAIAGVTSNKALSDYFTWHKEVSRMTGKHVCLTLYGAQFSDLPVNQREYVVEMGRSINLKYRQSESVLLQDYLACDFLISLSNEEGFGIPVADAIGFGLKVVARKIGAYEEQRSSEVGASNLRLGKDIRECCMLTKDLIDEMKDFGPTYFIAEERLDRYAGYIERYQNSSRAILSRVLTKSIEQ